MGRAASYHRVLRRPGEREPAGRPARHGVRRAGARQASRAARRCFPRSRSRSGPPVHRPRPSRRGPARFDTTWGALCSMTQPSAYSMWDDRKYTSVVASDAWATIVGESAPFPPKKRRRSLDVDRATEDRSDQRDAAEQRVQHRGPTIHSGSCRYAPSSLSFNCRTTTIIVLTCTMNVV